MFRRIANSQRLFQIGVVIAFLIFAVSLGIVWVLCYAAGLLMIIIAAILQAKAKKRGSDV
jgi:hypothetical protein